MQVEVKLKGQPWPIDISDVSNTYMKEQMYCVNGFDGVLQRFPIANIDHVVERKS